MRLSVQLTPWLSRIMLAAASAPGRRRPCVYRRVRSAGAGLPGLAPSGGLSRPTLSLSWYLLRCKCTAPNREARSLGNPHRSAPYRLSPATGREAPVGAGPPGQLLGELVFLPLRLLHGPDLSGAERKALYYKLMYSETRKADRKRAADTCVAFLHSPCSLGAATLAWSGVTSLHFTSL